MVSVLRMQPVRTTPNTKKTCANEGVLSKVFEFNYARDHCCGLYKAETKQRNTNKTFE